MSYDGDTTGIFGFITGRWRYRDYVIDAFNEDKPYDRFLREQIAGDELVTWRTAKEYTPEMDQLLFYLPLAGSAFKKVYYAWWR